MADLQRVYVDTCCFIDLVKVAQAQTLTSDKQQDVWHLQKLMEAQRDKEVELFTSTLTIAECRHTGDPAAVDDTVRANFTKLLLSGQYVKLVQMTPFIAQDARDLTWKHGMSLRGADSIHVASALDRSCTELLTGNGRLKKLGAEGAALTKLVLAIREPRQTTCLPEKYRQLELDGGQIH